MMFRPGPLKHSWLEEKRSVSQATDRFFFRVFSPETKKGPLCSGGLDNLNVD